MIKIINFKIIILNKNIEDKLHAGESESQLHRIPTSEGVASETQNGPATVDSY